MDVKVRFLAAGKDQITLPMKAEMLIVERPKMWIFEE